MRSVKYFAKELAYIKKNFAKKTYIQVAKECNKLFFNNKSIRSARGIQRLCIERWGGAEKVLRQKYGEKLLEKKMKERKEVAI